MRLIVYCISVIAVSLLPSCSSMHMGDPKAGTVASGSAGGSSSTGGDPSLEHCSAPLGTISLIEDVGSDWYHELTVVYKLPPSAQLLRLVIQQSNCFIVVERSAKGMRSMARERGISGSGEMRGGSHFGKRQVVAADYGLSPEVTFSNDNAAGSAIAGVAEMFGGNGFARLFGKIAGSSKTSEASTLLTLIDNRSGVQVAASAGSASNTDWGGFSKLIGTSVGGAISAYSNTSQGKVVTAAFLDSYNQMVKSLRQYKAQTVKGQGLGGGGRLGVDGSDATSQTGSNVGSNVHHHHHKKH